MQNKISTAEEFFKPFRNEDGQYGYREIEHYLKEFAKLHVQRALEAAYENSQIRVNENALIETGSCYTSYDDGVFTFTTDKQSILEAYPLDLIK